MEPTLEQYKNMLDNFDWLFAAEADEKLFEEGVQKMRELVRIAGLSDEYHAAYEEKYSQIYNY